MTSVTISGSVTSIGDNAFAGCASLTAVTIPNSVTSIGNSAFAGCTSLTAVTIPDRVTSIGDQAFYNCRLTGITIPNSVTSIGAGAFNLNRFTGFVIPDSVRTIGANAFYIHSQNGIAIGVGASAHNQGFINTASIVIGANVNFGWDTKSSTSGSFHSFIIYYNTHGKKAGTYTVKRNALFGSDKIGFTPR
jgi:hypothetical protein